MGNEEKWHKTERDLETALCNFCNSASDDPGDPALWTEETNRNFASLCVAYDAWYSWRRAQVLTD